MEDNYQKQQEQQYQSVQPGPNGQQPIHQVINVHTHEKESNGMGVAGFVLALISLFLSWVPMIGGILFLLGLIFSFIGVFRKPKGLAIAGLIISLITLIIMIIFAFALAGLYAEDSIGSALLGY
jgi:hypothetical protein